MLKPVSLSDVSVQPRLTWVDDTAVAERLVGAVGGGGGAAPQPGNLNAAMRVRQGEVPVVAWYSSVAQNVQPSLGSTASML